MHRFARLALLLLGSCLEINPGGADGGTAAPAPSPTSADAAANAEAAAGSNCAVDTATGILLCTTISLCPGVAVDHDLYPECGFRISGGATLDLECVCDDWLCPIGTALTCAQAAELLASQSQLSVCTQVSDGRCAARTSRRTPSTGCDRGCLSECGGNPGCITACGC